VITKKNFAYVVNTGGGAPATVTQFSVSSIGKLTTLGVTPARKEFALTDETLSANDKYLYVLAPSIAPGNSHIDEYKVKGNGTLSFVAATSTPLANGVSGLTGL